MFEAQPKFVFFGSSELSVKVLDILIKNGYTPDLIITVPDKPQGRKMVMTPPPIKVFAQANNLKIDQPNFLSSYNLQPNVYNLLIVASYGKIIPKSILDIPKFGTLNVHPSLLPKFRGPSPIQSFILSGEEKTGVTIMLMDEQIDHGPILVKRELEPSIFNFKFSKLNAKQMEEKLAELGGQMMVDIIPKWINKEIKAEEQDHSKATFTKIIKKEDALIDLNADPYQNFLKIQAYAGWPNAYFFTQRKGKKIRVVIKKASFENGKLTIEKIIPEGKKEMDYKDFLRGF